VHYQTLQKIVATFFSLFWLWAAYFLLQKTCGYLAGGNLTLFLFLGGASLIIPALPGALNLFVESDEEDSIAKMIGAFSYSIFFGLLWLICNNYYGVFDNAGTTTFVHIPAGITATILWIVGGRAMIYGSEVKESVSQFSNRPLELPAKPISEIIAEGIFRL